ncbi:hypothetical protein vseg_013198 [Gypsophila vaccaria]
MRSSTKLDESKPRSEETLRGIHRVAEDNSLRLQQLEMAIANLTSICSGLRMDVSSMLSVSVQGSVQKVQAEANEVKPHSSRSNSPGLDMKDQRLGLQMQQLVEQATALGIFKETKTTASSKVSGQVKDLRAQTRETAKNVQSTTTPQSSTNPLIQTKESTTQKKMQIKLGAIKNTAGTAQSKGKVSPQSEVNTQKPASTAKVTLRSTVKRTKTTISEVRLTNKNKDTSRPNISLKSSVQNVKTIERKGSLKLRIQAGGGDKSPTAMKSRLLLKTSSPSGAAPVAKPDLKPRRKWSTTKEITLIG